MKYTRHSTMMKDKTGKRRILLTVLLGCLLALLYYVIFFFSAQDGEQSSSLSQYVTRKGVGFVNSLSGGRWGGGGLAKLVERYERPLRKLAHFSEYACMGILVSLLLGQWMRRGRALYILTVVWVLLSAACDELHQYFVPGRYASPADVLLDTCGGACGMLLCVCAAALGRRRREKRTGMRKRAARKGRGKDLPGR